MLLLPTFLLLFTFSALGSATALTYKLTPNEKACFFTQVDQPGVKIAFYFAVCSPSAQSLTGCCLASMSFIAMHYHP